MKMTRRSFLKGLMVLAGAAAVEVSNVEWIEALEPEPEVEVVLQERPEGRLGSLRIDDQWYALHDADIVIDKFNADAIYVSGAVPGQFQMVGHVGGRIEAWTMNVDIGLSPEVDWHAPGLREFEIDTRWRGRCYQGAGYITSFGTFFPFFDADEIPCLVLEIAGSGNLKRL